MRVIILFSLFLQISLGVFSQGSFIPDLTGFSSNTLIKAKENTNVKYMTTEEQDVIFYMNLVRLAPKTYLETILIPYITYNELEKNPYVKSLIRDLKRAKPVREISAKSDLAKMAKRHRVDIGNNGISSHTGSKHQTFKKRSKGLMRSYYGMAENIGFGYNSAFENVIELLIDSDVPSLGHRKTILNGQFNCSGVSMGYHSDYGTCCVVDFGILE